MGGSLAIGEVAAGKLGTIAAVEVTATPSVNAVGTVADSVTAWRRDECSTKVLWPMGGVGPRS